MKTTENSSEVQGTETAKKEHTVVGLKMLAQKAIMLHKKEFISDEDLETILAIHQKAAIKYMQG